MIKLKMDELDCNYIYVATEEEKLFDIFEKEFPGKDCQTRESIMMRFMI